MEINLTKLLSADGRTETYDFPLEAKEYRISGKKYPVVSADPMRLEVKHEGNQVILLTGHFRLELRIPCGRCLEPVDYQFDMPLSRRADLKLSESEREDLEEETPYLNDKILDTEELIYQELIVHWPIRVLCKDDCKGICSRCGANLNHQTCSCETAAPDPRMAAIRDIFSKFKEV